MREVAVVRIPKPVDHEVTACIGKVADSPAALSRLLRTVGEPNRVKALVERPEWQLAYRELSSLQAKIGSHYLRHAPPDWP